MKIRLQHKETGKIKYIEKLEGYPVEVGDQLSFSRSGGLTDVWIVTQITRNPGNPKL